MVLSIDSTASAVIKCQQGDKCFKKIFLSLYVISEFMSSTALSNADGIFLHTLVYSLNFLEGKEDIFNPHL